MTCNCAECINQREYSGEFKEEPNLKELFRLVNVAIERLRSCGYYSLAINLEYEIKKYEQQP